MGPPTAFAADCRPSVMICTKAWPTTGPTDCISPGSCVSAVETMVATRGTMFLAAVSTDSTRSAVRVCMSALSLPSSVTQFVHAAFAMLTEPSMVVAASRAVVPAICCFS